MTAPTTPAPTNTPIPICWECPDWCTEGVEEYTARYEGWHIHRRVLRDGRVTVTIEQFVRSIVTADRGLGGFNFQPSEPAITLHYEGTHPDQQIDGRFAGGEQTMIGGYDLPDVDVISRLLAQAREYLVNGHSW